MAAVDKGVAYLFGVVTGTVSNAAVQSFSLDQEFANKAETLNESGNVVERRYDDRTTKATFELKIVSGYSMPALGDQITFNSIKYVIETINRAEKCKDFVMINLSAITSEGITLS